MDAYFAPSLIEGGAYFAPADALTLNPPPTGTITNLPLVPDGQNLRIVMELANATSGSYTLVGQNGAANIGPTAFDIANNAADFVVTGIAPATYLTRINLVGPDGTAQIDGNQITIIGVSGGGGVAEEVPDPTVTSVVVTPSTATVSSSAPIDFDAIVNGTNSPTQAVTWSVTAGTVNSNGTVTPPPRTFLIQEVIVTATSVLDPSKSGSATIIILALPIPTEGNPMDQQVDLSQLINQTQLGPRAQRALSVIIEGLIDDIAALRAGQLQLAAKLDQDAGVSDTNYSTTVATTLGSAVVIK